MGKRMIIFVGVDVDNNLCELNSRINVSTLKYLHEIKDRGVKNNITIQGTYTENKIFP